MKMRTKTRPLRQPGDSKVMSKAVDWCEAWADENHARFYRPTDDSLMLVCLDGRNVRHWPDAGTTQVNSEPRIRGEGLQALIQLLTAETKNIDAEVSFRVAGIANH